VDAFIIVPSVKNFQDHLNSRRLPVFPAGIKNSRFPVFLEFPGVVDTLVPNPLSDKWLTVIEQSDHQTVVGTHARNMLPTSKSLDESTTTITTTTVLRPFFQDHPGEPVPEENFWTLWCIPPYFLQAGCPSCRPTDSVKALKATSAFGLGRRR